MKKTKTKKRKGKEVADDDGLLVRNATKVAKERNECQLSAGAGASASAGGAWDGRVVGMVEW